MFSMKPGNSSFLLFLMDQILRHAGYSHLLIRMPFRVHPADLSHFRLKTSLNRWFSVSGSLNAERSSALFAMFTTL